MNNTPESSSSSDIRFDRILVPVDFTAVTEEEVAAGHGMVVGNQHLDFARASIRAVELAAALARQCGGQLRLVHATPALDFSRMYTGPAGVSLPAQVVEEIHEQARTTSLEVLAFLAGRYCENLPVSFAARPGVAFNVVLAEAAHFHADLVVLAASGRSRVARFFVGSTADRLIRHAECPVLVVPTSGH